ncbi:hypothetical protein [Mangrovicoccus sp. HB161399]|uniref:hypothetical protein n=1 Tax=Mangrovicoccus sp. HB161399 TaxID=2720392 RepID=UPI0015580A9A|nr:hypothetical protein [Mangrovicoccus sp. HB161399]
MAGLFKLGFGGVLGIICGILLTTWVGPTTAGGQTFLTVVTALLVWLVVAAVQNIAARLRKPGAGPDGGDS